MSDGDRIRRLEGEIRELRRMVDRKPKMHENQGVAFDHVEMQVESVRPGQLTDGKFQTYRDPDDDSRGVLLRIGGVAVMIPGIVIEQP